MEDCELCGRKTDSVNVILVEDIEFRVCDRCAEGKKVISRPKGMKKDPHREVHNIKQDSGAQEEILVANYGEVIRKGREVMDLPLKVVAEMLNEKHSLLRRIEEQNAKPPVELRKKLEHLLNIKLTELPKDYDEGKIASSRPTGKPTIGDFLEPGR
jgi:uncharacterized protein (TIGR00270 family)